MGTKGGEVAGLPTGDPIWAIPVPGEFLIIAGKALLNPSLYPIPGNGKWGQIFC